MPALVTRRAPGAPPLLPSVIRRLAEDMLRALDLEKAELSVLLTNDRQIHALNRQHREKDRPTDVLAFPLADDGATPGDWLGDVVISLETAQRQADSRRRPLLEEVRFLLAHGLLHLIGYDHDTRPHKREMDAMARKLVRSAAIEATPRRRSVRKSGSRRRPS